MMSSYKIKLRIYESWFYLTFPPISVLILFQLLKAAKKIIGQILHFWVNKKCAFNSNCSKLTKLVRKFVKTGFVNSKFALMNSSQESFFFQVEVGVYWQYVGDNGSLWKYLFVFFIWLNIKTE